MAILYFQSYSTTNFSHRIFRETIEEALEISRNCGRVAGLAIGARPDQVPDDILDIIEAVGEENSVDVWLELGVQTIDPSGLKWLRRGHGLEEIEDTLSRSAGRKVFICAHLISGIPGETRGQLARSACRMAELGVHALKFHPLHVLTGTYLEKMFLSGYFEPVTIEGYISEVVHALRVLPKGVMIQRLTADASPPLLVAPGWINDKPRVIDLINKSLNDLEAFQGDMSTFSSGCQYSQERPGPEER